MRTSKYVYWLASAAMTMNLAACGGGGGSTASVATAPVSASASTYQAGMAAGENGVLTIDPASLTYRLNITDSSFGMSGQSFSGAVTANADGSYHISGTQDDTIFVYPNYAILSGEITKGNPVYSKFYEANPYITNSVFMPIFALKHSALITTTDALTASGSAMEMRGLVIGGNTISGNTNGVTRNYYDFAFRGNITKVNQTEFKVNYCQNDGSSAQNSNLTPANCTGGLVQTKTFTYDPNNSGAWLVTPTNPNHPQQIIRAYFVPDTQTNTAVGYFDISDSANTSAGFAFMTVAPASATAPLGASGAAKATATYTSYQLCLSDANCASTNGQNGIYVNNAITIPFTSSQTTDGTGCNQTVTVDSPSNGFISSVVSPPANSAPGTPGTCTASGDRPDVMILPFGPRVVNGKNQLMTASVGWDSTVTNAPSQKFTIGTIQQN